MESVAGQNHIRKLAGMLLAMRFVAVLPMQKFFHYEKNDNTEENINGNHKGLLCVFIGSRNEVDERVSQKRPGGKAH